MSQKSIDSAHISLSALDVANYFLTIADPEDGISHLKLQKLCYYAQGMHLAVHGRPLFRGALMRWREGPVARAVWQHFRFSGSAPLDADKSFEAARFPKDAAAFVRRVYEEYGQYSASKLRDMTHSEEPYLEAKANHSTTLSQETVQRFFLGQLEARLAKRPRLNKKQVRELVLNDPTVGDAVARGRADFAAGRYSAA